MATFFGEVIFSSSRACPSDAYDDDDDEEEENEELHMERCEIVMTPKIEKKLSCCAFIVSFGQLANDFTQGCIRNDDFKLIGNIEIKKVNEKERIDTGDFRPKVFKKSSLFLSEKGTLICGVSADVTPNLSWKFAKQVLSLIDEACPILVLSSHHISKLNSEMDGGQRCASYCLHSPNFPSLPVFPSLPQPSVLESVPAAIMTASLVENRHCMICASYMESFWSGDVDLVEKNYMKAISVPPFANLVHYDLTTKRSFSRSDLFDRYL